MTHSSDEFLFFIFSTQYWETYPSRGGVDSGGMGLDLIAFNLAFKPGFSFKKKKIKINQWEEKRHDWKWKTYGESIKDIEGKPWAILWR